MIRVIFYLNILAMHVTKINYRNRYDLKELCSKGQDNMCINCSFFYFDQA